MGAIRITREQADKLFALIENQDDHNEQQRGITQQTLDRLVVIAEELEKVKRRLDELEPIVYELTNRQ